MIQVVYPLKGKLIYRDHLLFKSKSTLSIKMTRSVLSIKSQVASLRIIDFGMALLIIETPSALTVTNLKFYWKSRMSKVVVHLYSYGTYLPQQILRCLRSGVSRYFLIPQTKSYTFKAPVLRLYPLKFFIFLVKSGMKGHYYRRPLGIKWGDTHRVYTFFVLKTSEAKSSIMRS